MENQEKIKKPIYKKWWFWLIVVVIVISIYVGGSSNNLNTTTSDNYPKNSEIEVTVADFSSMTEDEVNAWFTSNKINGSISEEYSESVTKGSFVSQSIVANTIIHEGDKITVVYSLGKEPSTGEQNALSKAKSYLDYSSFSYKGLIEQLEFEGFSTEEAIYGADNCGADWNEQAAKKAKSYMEYSSFSRNGLIEQLEYEGFTTEQAEYGVTAVGY